MSRSYIVTSIRRKGKTVVVGFANREEVVLDPDILKAYSIKVDVEIPADSLAEIIYESDRKRAGDYAAYLLSARGYSSGMLKSKMTDKGYGAKATASVLAELKKGGLLDDNKYARQTAESMLRRKPAGRNFLVAYLQSRHVSHRIAEEAVAEVMKNVDEVELAQRLLQKIRSRLINLELETARTKAYNYLSRRAIGYNAAKKAFDIMWKKEMDH